MRLVMMAGVELVISNLGCYKFAGAERMVDRLMNDRLGQEHSMRMERV